MRRSLAVALIAIAGCGEGSPLPPSVSVAPGDLAVLVSGDENPAVLQAAADASDLLGRIAGESVPLSPMGATSRLDDLDASPVGNFLVVGDGPLTEALAPGLAHAGGAEGYGLAAVERGRHRVWIAAGGDPLGKQYAVYDLLERAGVRFFHPEATLVPEGRGLKLPFPLREVHRPAFRLRGFHQHTLHPIPALQYLMVAGGDRLAYAERYVDWLVRNRQNLLTWAILDSVPWDDWLPYAREVVRYAHDRGVRVGANVGFYWAQQNLWNLLDTPSEAAPEMERKLDRLMEVPWDLVAVELGGTEFQTSSDVWTVEWMDELARLLGSRYPWVEPYARVHVTAGLTAPSLGGNFFFLPRFADPRIGVLIHTVMFYDLFRPAPAYGWSDFSGQRRFLFDMLGSRRVGYWPETAYWVTFDVDVPVFLPVYLQSRALDASALAGRGLDAHLTFTSGDEWGYWLNDYGTAAFAWEPDLGALVRKFAGAFGEGAPAAGEALLRVIEAEGEALVLRNLTPYLSGENALTEAGWALKPPILTQPRRISFRAVASMSEDEARAFDRSDLLGLERLSASLEGAARILDGARPRVPPEAAPWWEELADGISVTDLRVRHSLALYRSILALRRGDRGGAASGLALARGLTAQARALVLRREASYRYPRLWATQRPLENPTWYPYGYLADAHDMTFWTNQEGEAAALVGR